MPADSRTVGARPVQELELALYRRIFDSAHDAIAIVDSEGRYLEQNVAHQRLLGFSDAEINGQTPGIHLGEESFAHIADELRRAGRFNGEVSSRTRDGRPILLELSAFTMNDDQGNVLCHVVSVVTARRHAVESMQRSEKLAMIGRLAASIAHEINNPLESVTNLLYLIEHHPHLHPEIHEYARVAGSELARVAHISRQTLAFYRESADPMLVRLPDLLDDIIRLYNRKLDRRRVRVIRQYELDREVCLYPAEIRQIFSNLLMNAFEAVAEAGVITIGVKWGLPWSGSSTAGVRITVSDNGHGIQAENRSRIFEPFFTTKGEKGTGLGLWVTNGLVQKQGGSIRLRTSTKPDYHGTVFSVFLPEAGPRRAAQQPRAA